MPLHKNQLGIVNLRIQIIDIMISHDLVFSTYLFSWTNPLQVHGHHILII